ncbi:hypothetical protein TIFTF001_043448, partial [Ficus carica]
HTHSETWGLENSREDTLVDALAIPESEKQGSNLLNKSTFGRKFQIWLF